MSDKYAVQRITTEDGLSNNTAIALLQDSDGFIWIGTGDGLNRYDGVKFTHYYYDKYDTNTISGNYINSLIEDRNGTLWIGTNQGGLNKYDKRRGTFESYQYNKNNPFSIGQGSIYSIAEDHFGNLWIAVNPSGLYFFETKDKNFYHYLLAGEDNNEGIRTYNLFVDNKNNLWVGTIKGLYEIQFRIDHHQLDERTQLKSFKYISENSEVRYWGSNETGKDHLKPREVEFITEQVDEKKHSIWVAQWPGLAKMELDGDHRNILDFTRYNKAPFNSKNWTLCIDNSNQLWIGSYHHGVHYADLNTNSKPNFIQLKVEDGNSNIADWTIRSIIKDTFGNIWIGSEQHGILKLIPNKLDVDFLVKDDNKSGKTIGISVESILIDSKNRVWVGTKYNGASRFELSLDGKITNLKNYRTSGRKNSIPHNYVRDIFEDSKNRIWLGFWDISGGFALYNPKTDDFTRFQHDPLNDNSLSENQVLDLDEAPNGDLLIGTSEKGLDRFNYESRKFTHYQHDPLDTLSISSNRVSSIMVDSRDRIWLGTFGGGLNRYLPEKNEFIKYTYTGDQNGPSDDRINSFFEDSNGLLWFTTPHGLNLFNSQNGEFKHFFQGEGFPANSFRSVIQALDHKYWITSDRGLSMMDSTMNKVVSFGLNDGLPAINFTTNTLKELNTGELLIGSRNGLLRFKPESKIKNKERSARVFFTSFKVFNIDFPLDTVITYKKHIILNYNQNFFSFEFAMLDFTDPEKNTYRYRIKGLLDEWTVSNKQNYINFIDMNPGEYILDVSGLNGNGEWSRQTASVKISILPPFWATFWFRSLMVVGLILSSSIYVKIIITAKYKRKLRQLEVERKVQEERERISADLHDNIGSNLTSLVTGLELTQKYLEHSNTDRVSENIVSLETQTRKTIDHLRQAIWSLQDNVKTCGDLIEKVRELTRTQVVTEFKPQPRVICQLNDKILITPLKSLNLFRIIQEAFHNAFKYSGAKNITIHFSMNSAGKLCIVLQDDGSGFDYHKCVVKANGYGLQNMKRRADRIGAALEIESRIGSGTTVLIEVDL